MQLADNALASGELPICRTVKPHVVITVDGEDLADPDPNMGAAATGFGDLLSSGEQSIDETIHVTWREDVVLREVAELPEPQRSVVRLRYGLDGSNEPRTVTKVARELGLTAKEVRRAEEQALVALSLQREMQSLREAA